MRNGWRNGSVRRGSPPGAACSTSSWSGSSSARIPASCHSSFSVRGMLRLHRILRTLKRRAARGGLQLMNIIERLHGEVIAPIKQRFVGRDEITDLIALTVV